MWTMERQGIAVLVLLDLSAAFGAIDHNVLLARMEELQFYSTEVVHIIPVWKNATSSYQQPVLATT